MACDKSSLETSACSNGFAQAAQNEQQFRALVLQLLCEINGGGSSSAIYHGDYDGGEPPFSPTVETAIAFDTENGQQWNFYDGVWH